MDQPTLITLLGPTAAGKTKMAAALAYELEAEIISADSRQVFRRMDIGTGKDLADYKWEGEYIMYHLVDVADPGEEFSVYRFRREFERAFDDIVTRKKVPLMCGGTGLYLESVLSDYDLRVVPVDAAFREEAQNRSMNSLLQELMELQPLHNTTDSKDRERLIRALEIARYQFHNPYHTQKKYKDIVLGLRFERTEIRRRISSRLYERLNLGMIEEVRKLIDDGISIDSLLNYGLEYKYVTQYLTGKHDYESMTSLLETAIHQFAKKQMTWFRRMERNGIKIFWLEGEDGFDENLQKAKDFIRSA